MLRRTGEGHVACDQNLEESVNACPLPHLLSFFNSYFFQITSPDYTPPHRLLRSTYTTHTFTILTHPSFLYLSVQRACQFTPSSTFRGAYLSPLSLYRPAFIIIGSDGDRRRHFILNWQVFLPYYQELLLIHTSQLNARSSHELISINEQFSIRNFRRFNYSSLTQTSTTHHGQLSLVPGTRFRH